MKIDRAPPPFTPVVITLETQEELDVVFEAIGRTNAADLFPRLNSTYARVHFILMSLFDPLRDAKQGKKVSETVDTLSS